MQQLRSVMLLHAAIVCLLKVGMISASKLSTIEKTTILDFHNQVRVSVFPHAADMRELMWDNALEAAAQTWADKCVFEHSAATHENLFSGSDNEVRNAVMAWFIEREDYTWGATTPCASGKVCGHYRVMVYGHMNRMGCARQKCGSRNYINCQYKTVGGTHIGKIGSYQKGKVCSKCPKAAPYCKKDACSSSGTCNLICLNCGTKSSSSSSCSCTCPTGYSGDQCETAAASAQLPSGCDACAAAGTPCQNGGTASSGSSCKCSCASGYTGEFCQKKVAQYDQSVNLYFGSMYKKNNLYYPTPHYQSTSIITAFGQFLTAEINKLCRTIDYFKKCCPNGGTFSATTAASKNIISTSDMKIADAEVMSSGEVKVIIYFEPQATNPLCSANSRKRRAASNVTPLSQKVIFDAATNIKSNSELSMKTCCEVTLSKHELGSSVTKSGERLAIRHSLLIIVLLLTLLR